MKIKTFRCSQEELHLRGLELACGEAWKGYILVETCIPQAEVASVSRPEKAGEGFDWHVWLFVFDFRSRTFATFPWFSEDKAE